MSLYRYVVGGGGLSPWSHLVSRLIVQLKAEPLSIQSISLASTNQIPNVNKTFFRPGGVVCLVVSSPPATEGDYGSMRREIESCQGIGW
jgi:hypothetical protein